MILKKVITGGQTGVDRAGLDAAMQAGIPVGGYCPRGRVAEDGTIPSRYPLFELASSESHYRIEQNIINSSGTLILNRGELSQGTKLTRFYAVKYGKPNLVVQLDTKRMIPPSQTIRWLEGQFISILNVAGPRESKCSGIYEEAFSYLVQLFSIMKE